MRHLADADLWAQHGNAEVIDYVVVIDPHDALQAHAPEDKEAGGADVQCQPGTATPAAHGFPKWADAADCISVRNTQHRAAETLQANPWITEAPKDAIVKIVLS